MSISISFRRARALLTSLFGSSFANLGKFAATLILFQAAVFATPVFTSQFSDPNNVGNIGGGLLTGSASDVDINQGPWQGTYHGILGLLAPPDLDIDPGSGTISGIVGVNLIGLGLTNNYGWFFQDTGQGYLPDTMYTLSADISTGGLLGIQVLSNAGVGIGLTAGGDTLVGSSTDPAAIVGLQLLSGTTYQLTYQFTTGASAPSGNIGIRLFDQPEGLLTTNLLSGVTFSDVSLDASAPGAVPEPASLALTGIGLVALGFRFRKKTKMPVATERLSQR